MTHIDLSLFIPITGGDLVSTCIMHSNRIDNNLFVWLYPCCVLTGIDNVLSVVDRLLEITLWK